MFNTDCDFCHNFLYDLVFEDALNEFDKSDYHPNFHDNTGKLDYFGLNSHRDELLAINNSEVGELGFVAGNRSGRLKMNSFEDIILKTSRLTFDEAIFGTKRSTDEFGDQDMSTKAEKTKSLQELNAKMMHVGLFQRGGFLRKNGDLLVQRVQSLLSRLKYRKHKNFAQSMHEFKELRKHYDTILITEQDGIIYEERKLPRDLESFIEVSLNRQKSFETDYENAVMEREIKGNFMTKKIKAGRLNDLLFEIFTLEGGNEFHELEELLLTIKPLIFEEPEDFMEHLFQRFEKTVLEESKVSQCVQLRIIHLRGKLFSFIANWIDMSPNDFSDQREAKSLFKCFEGQDNVLWPTECDWIYHQLRTTDEINRTVNIHLNASPRLSPLDHVRLIRPNALQFEPQTLVRHLDRIERMLASQLQYDQILRYVKGKPSTAVTSFISHYNRLGNLLISELLECDEDHQRHRLYKHLVKAANGLLQLGAMNSFKAVIAALQSSPIHRLNLLTPKQTKIYSQLEEIDSAKNNFEGLRDHENKNYDHVCPWLGLVLRDLTFVLDCQSLYVNGDFINLDLSRMIANVFAHFNHFRGYFRERFNDKWDWEHLYEVQEWQREKRIVYFTEDQQWARSLGIK